MNNIIVTESASSMRALAREALRGNWKEAVLATLVYYVAVMIPMDILNMLFGGSDSYSFVSFLYSILVSGPFTLGLTMFCLDLFRKKDFQIAQIFYGFEHFGKAIGLYLVMVLFICLWLLLFIVPGIIAAFRYSQAFVVLADHPEYGIMQCMDESKRMMTGNKSKLFCLEISFIGWGLLASVPTMVLSILLFGESGPLFTSLISYIGSVGYLWLTPYVMVATISFYEILVGNLRPGTFEENYDSGVKGQDTYYVESPVYVKEPEPAVESPTPVAYQPEAVSEQDAVTEAAPETEEEPVPVVEAEVVGIANAEGEVVDAEIVAENDGEKQE